MAANITTDVEFAKGVAQLIQHGVMSTFYATSIAVDAARTNVISPQRASEFIFGIACADLPDEGSLIPGGKPGFTVCLTAIQNLGYAYFTYGSMLDVAKAEDATIMPALLCRVPRGMPFDSALPAQCDGGMALLEAIEQLATRQGVAVDARVGRGRTYRDALNRLLEQEHFDQVIVSATDSPRVGLSADDLKWLLEHVPAEILIPTNLYRQADGLKDKSLR